MKMKFVFKIIIPVLIAAVLILFAQALVMPKYMDELREGAMIPEYYKEENHGNNDVMFIGDCEVYENFSPAVLWEEYGIPSYIRGSAQQLIWQTYYLMKETYRYDTPKVMVFNVLEMIYNTPESTGDQESREAYNRMNFDGMRWSADKWNSIRLSMTKEEREKDGIWSYVFPLLRYHSRITELSADDWNYLFRKDAVTDNGYLMQVKVNPVLGEFNKRPLVDYSFGDTCWDYLERIRKLCEEHGTQLILIKAPSLSPVWYDEWETQIEEYAAEHSLPYINFLEKQEEIGIDWNTDTYDRGLHLNVYGAEKLTSYFGAYLRDEAGLADRRSDESLAALWTEKTAAYEARKSDMIAAWQKEEEK